MKKVENGSVIAGRGTLNSHWEFCDARKCHQGMLKPTSPKALCFHWPERPHLLPVSTAFFASGCIRCSGSRAPCLDSLPGEDTKLSPGNQTLLLTVCSYWLLFFKNICSDVLVKARMHPLAPTPSYYSLGAVLTPSLWYVLKIFSPALFPFTFFLLRTILSHF